MQLSIHLGFRVHRSANLCAQQLPVARPQSSHVAAQSGGRETETNSQVIVSRQRIGAASKEDSYSSKSLCLPSAFCSAASRSSPSLTSASAQVLSKTRSS